MSHGEEPAEYIIEYAAVGNAVKVTAFDPVTLHEVSIVGPVHAPRQYLAETAIRKLKYALAKDKEE